MQKHMEKAAQLKHSTTVLDFSWDRFSGVNVQIGLGGRVFEKKKTFQAKIES